MHKLTHVLAAASIAALVSLSACKQEAEVVNEGGTDPQAAELAKAKPVALPPSIISSHAYRCKDNSLIYVDFLSDQKTANYRIKKADDPVVLTASEAGQPFTAPGYKVTGSGTHITVSAPGKGSQSCKA
jgi:hypothetical protein